MLDYLMDHFPNTRVYDVTPFYSDFVNFTANSVYPVHRWYRFKEGFSRDLVHLILGSFGKSIDTCLDPFGGSGTTALACQEVGVRCHTIEVNPFLHHVAKMKLTNSYCLAEFDNSLNQVMSVLVAHSNEVFPEPMMSTITERPNLDSWIFSRTVLQAILEIRQSFTSLDPLYSNLLLVVLASILTEVSNTTKDGKCIRYKKNWRTIALTREDVVTTFLERSRLFRDDIQYLRTNTLTLPDNAELCVQGNALENLKKYAKSSVDAVITSPPYLNSFDYTDVYMPELWALGFVKNYEDVRRLREATFRSHVQVKWNIDESSLSESLKSLIAEVVKGRESLWNDAIPNMIAGYFLDMQNLLGELKRVVRTGGKLCIVVGTSSYYGVTIPTDLMLANLARVNGFDFEEMRIVRKLNRSSQQAGEDDNSLPPLRESILILRST